MSRLSAFCLIILAAIGFNACNSSSEELEYTLPSSALVKSFYLSSDNKILDNLDKVFFSIDLANGNIFNADSMPYGTKINKLVPKITTGGASAVELVVPRPGKSDTTYNYITNSGDSIDFSNGPVQLKIKSIDESVTMIYSVHVNVHQVKSDSLSWGSLAYESLPTTLASVEAQHTVRFNNSAYCLTTDGTSYCMAISANPATRTWTKSAVNFGFKPQIESFRCSSDALYILSDDGELYSSADGSTWQATGKYFDYLIGGYADKIIGTAKIDGKWIIVTSAGETVDAPVDFPVSGASIPVEYSFPMSSSRQFTILGGRTSDGRLTGAAWGYDGTNWACLSSRSLPEALEGVTLTPYFTFSENVYWVATQESIFVAIGGRNAAGKCNTTTYISYNYGMSWMKAPELMQLPTNVPALYGAQTLLFSSLLGSRASVAITSWECPYIYMFGGRNAEGKTNSAIWRGVINRLSFKPIQ